MDPFPPAPPVGGGAGSAGAAAAAAAAPEPAVSEHGVIPRLASLRIGSSGGGVSGTGGGSPSLDSWRPSGAGGAGDSGGGGGRGAGGGGNGRSAPAAAAASGGGFLDGSASPAGSVVSLPGSRTPPPLALGGRGAEVQGEQEEQDGRRHHHWARAGAEPGAGAEAAAAPAPRPLAAELDAATVQAAAAEQQQHAAYEAASLADAARALADADALLRPPPPPTGEERAKGASSPPPSSPPRAPPFSARRESAGTAAATAAASRRPFIIGVAGGTASGKTTVCDRIMQRLNDQTAAVLLSQDSFYKPLSPEESERARRSAYNFDVPDAFDTPLLLACLKQLCEGRSVDVPLYDFATHSRLPGRSRKVEPAPVIVVEGILVLAVPEVREALSMKVYVDTDDDVRLARRIQRDVAVRGRDVGGVIAQYQRFVKPAFDTYIGPSRRHADVIIPWQQRFDSPVAGGGSGGAAGATTAGGAAGGGRGDAAAAAAGRPASAPSGSASATDAVPQQQQQQPQEGTENTVAIDLIAEHIRSKLKQHPLRRLYPQLEVVPSNFQLRGLHTILRDRETEAGDFAFFADRVNRLVIEAGLGHLPFEEKTVVTPTGHRYVGVAFCRGICGVSVIRSGEAMEAALRECCQGIKIGKILVHRHGLSQEEVVYERLPADIADRHVLLLDPVLGTGHTACRAIQVVLARGVPQHRVLFLCLIATPEGVARVARSFPGVRIVASEVDARLDERFRVVPGIGQFGDRYFGL